MTSDAQAQLLAALSERYRIERELGAGGMATVYLARDLKHDREVALKVLRPELGAVLGAERFLAEIRITARLDHPHILTLIDSGASDGFLYYVLPYARGESLREKLQREKQLSLEEALAITKQIASALDYAHRQGVVHRDIKPENILLHEGEAMLADFGIALGVKEAGGNRLTETGLSLGTPQYMSPEQATGDRQVDARSDVYSLAAVLYEMLAGEPPVTGPTAQAMIAKLMMERPTRLRVVRESVPEPVDAAVAKALDKTPADRFATAGDFMRALELRPAPLVAPKRSVPVVAIVVTAVAVLAAVGALVATGKFSHGGAQWVLRDRTQLTFTGNVLAAAISLDGKQLAFWSKHCAGPNCQYAIDVQDVGGTTTRRILDGATNASALEWSPDRRNLIFQGTMNKRFGTYLVSALGGKPRFLTSGAATFWAGGDSLLVSSAVGAPREEHFVGVTSLDGAVADSIRVAGLGIGITGLSVQPGGRSIVSLIIEKGRGFWQVMDRNGKVTDAVRNSCTCPGVMSTDALFLTRAGRGFESIVRVGVDPATGKFASHQDTLLSGNFNNFTVVGDGKSLVIADGTSQYSVWALDLADAFHDRFADPRRVLKSSTPANGDLSPDGGRLLVTRTLPSSAGAIERRYSVMNFDGTGEKQLAEQAAVVGVHWTDSVTLLVRTQTPKGSHVALIDVRTGAQTRSVDLPDSIYRAVIALRDGWAWIPASGDKLVVQRGGAAMEIDRPTWFGELFRVDVDDAQTHFVLSGWNAGTFDSLGVAVVPVEGGTPVMWATSFAEGGDASFAPDGSLILEVWPTAESVTLSRVRAPGKIEFLGTVGRPAAGFSVSRDLKRAVVREQEYHGDAYMSRLGRP